MAQKTFKQRINNIIGQLNGISSMMDSNQDILEVTIQLKAAKSALSRLMQLYTQQELEKYINSKIDKNQICSQLIKELVYS